MPTKCPIPLSTCRSTQLSHMGYDPKTKQLAIRFQGKPTIYVYDNVPQSHFDAMLAAHADEKQSVGKYFTSNIKPHKHLYPFTKIVEDGERHAT